jgi:tetraprenyl-beta-curcumene synthase
MNERRRTPGDAIALLGVAWRGVTWTIPSVRRELRRWRKRALQIPDPALRADALETLRREHMNAHGAALFAVLPRARSLPLLRLLVAFQVALDYLDTVTERPAADERPHGDRLHRALVDALDPDAEPTDYYGERPWEDDGGYLRALVEVCQRECAALPGYTAVRPYAASAAGDLSVQVLNHLTHPADRDSALRSWADGEEPRSSDLPWFERAGAASATLGIFALLAAAASHRLSAPQVRAIDAAYRPTICLLSTLMDSLADYDEDRTSGAHSYIAHYGSNEAAIERISALVTEGLADVRRLPSGSRHAVIVTGMVAMYLAQGRLVGAWKIQARAGWITAVAMPVTRLMDLRRRPQLVARAEALAREQAVVQPRE